MILFGSKGYHDLKGYLIEQCNNCEQVNPLSVYEVKKKFTLYFIPTFSYSTKLFTQCHNCNNVTEISERSKDKILAKVLTKKQVEKKLDEARNTMVANHPHETKSCPFCAEEIKAAAIVCRYCKRDLE